MSKFIDRNPNANPPATLEKPATAAPQPLRQKCKHCGRYNKPEEKYCFYCNLANWTSDQ